MAKISDTYSRGFRKTSSRGTLSIHVHTLPYTVNSFSAGSSAYLSFTSFVHRTYMQLIEISIPSDPGAALIYEALAELIASCIKDLRRYEHVDTTDFTAARGLSSSFDESIRRQLASMWHLVSPKTRQIVSDLRTLRMLATYLHRFDAITFLTYLETLRATEGANCAWLFHSAAHTIFEAAKSRVYRLGEKKEGGKEGKKGGKSGSNSNAKGKNTKKDSGNQSHGTDDMIETSTKGGGEVMTVPTVEPVLEELPKWHALIEVIQEARDNQQKRLVRKRKNEKKEWHQSSKREKRDNCHSDDDDNHDDDYGEEEEGGEGKAEHEKTQEPFFADTLTDASPSHRLPHFPPILVFCQDEQTCHQLRHIIDKAGPSNYMKHLYKEYLQHKVDSGIHASARRAARSTGDDRSHAGVSRDNNRSNNNGSHGKVGTSPSTSMMMGSYRPGEEAALAKEALEIGARKKARVEGSDDGAAPKSATTTTTTTAAAAIPAESKKTRVPGDANAAKDRVPAATKKRRGRGVRATDAAAAVAIALSKNARHAADVAMHQKAKKANFEDCNDEGDEPESNEDHRNGEDGPAVLNKAKTVHGITDNGKQGQQIRHNEQDEHKLLDDTKKNDNDVIFVALETTGALPLWHYEPFHIIVYDPDVSLTRSIEVYTAQHPHHGVRVYMLRYEDSPEMDKYQAAAARERSAFENLIRGKGIMAPVTSTKASGIRRDDPYSLASVTTTAYAASIDTRNGDALGLPSNGPSVGNNAVTRQAGGRLFALGNLRQERTKIVVDVREFMSSLPAVLYAQGFDIIPLTLEIGDYVLSPELVVERKTLSDLRGSLFSGRLYQQAESMCKHYRTAVLLIEFDGDKTFGLQSLSELGDDIQAYSLMSRLVLLCLHHPRLRLVWSRSLHATGDIFKQLKANHEEPDPLVAATVGVSGDDDVGGDTVVNAVGIDILKRLPGVTEANWRALMREGGSLAGLATVSLDRLTVVMGGEVVAKKLYDFLHEGCRALFRAL